MAPALINGFRGIPYSVVWGNHDIGSKPGKFSDVHNTAMANKYFPLSDYMQKNYWGGSADGKTLDNYYICLLYTSPSPRDA